jgi:cytochrome c oxidase subunit II
VDIGRLITTNEAIDPVFMFIFGACLVLLIGITAVMLFFVVRYHRSRAPEPTSQVSSNLTLEIIWIVLPTLLVMAMFYYGWSGYLTLRRVPKDALPVTATARMWSWSFTYPNGKSSPKLYVPAGKAVRVELVSKDVLHGFFVPAFRVKRDVVPGMSNYAWFVAAKPGSYDIFCSSYCGAGHSAMITTVEALPGEVFAAWLQQAPDGVRAAGNTDGRKLAQEKGCLGCHSLDGSPSVGPTFKGLFGSQVKVLAGGKPVTVTADEAYLTESIREPLAKIVEGFPPIMPAESSLSDADVHALVELIEGLK